MVAVLSGLYWKVLRERHAWREGAISRIATIWNAEAIRAEVAELSEAVRTNRSDLRWAHAKTLLMANGERLVFEYKHGANDYFPPHTFVALGSDGSWYTSRHHFCNAMGMVEFDPQPASIAEFAKRYSARPIKVSLKLRN